MDKEREDTDFSIKCLNAPYMDYMWLKEHCYRTLKVPCPPNVRTEHLAILDLIREHEERQKIEDILDKIEVEICELLKVYPFVDHIDAYVKVDDVKKIIDKYIEKGEMEE